MAASDVPAPGPSPEQLEALLVEALGHLEAGGSLDAFLAAQPAARRAWEPLLRQHLDRLREMGLTDPGPPGATGFPERLGDFELLECLGQGGMGVVYRARQVSLGREVALKLIRPEQLYFPGARERFAREVMVVARMQHPGIVPVYAVGTEGGVPCFAMELVRGASLAAVIEAVAGRAPDQLEGRDLEAAVRRIAGSAADRGDRGHGGGEGSMAERAGLYHGPWTSVSLRILREVAEALEHAHRRGVLHRDVKPSNVMLTLEGRVLLLDFGLSSDGAGERLTRTGSQLGSLAYMAPERLDGLVMDARADVYSLGATLYELLTLRLPYQASDAVRLRRQAGAADRPRLATLNPAIAWEHETICAKALDPDPARRYESAAAFARDLDHALARRPIEARRASTGLRLRRWAQRHPARATGAAAAALALVVGPSAIAWQERQARDLITAQRDELSAANGALAGANAELARSRERAEAENARAQGNFEQLLAAVDAMLTRVGDESLRDVPRMETVRRELLAEALAFYEGFLAERSADPALRQETAEIHARLAIVHGMLGDFEAAESSFDASAQLYRELGEPGVPGLARIEALRSRAQRLVGDVEAARRTAERAIELSGSAGPAGSVDRGAARLERALALTDAGELAASIEELEASLAELAPLFDTGDETLHRDAAGAALLARTRDQLGVAVCRRAMSTQDEDSFARAAELHREAASTWQRLLELQPHDAQFRRDRALNLGNLGVALTPLGEHETALAHFRASARISEALARDFPAMPYARSDAAGARASAGGRLFDLGRFAEAATEFELAAASYEQLIAAHPNDDGFLGGLVAALQGRALCSWKDGRHDEASSALRSAVEVLERALSARPTSPVYRYMGAKLCETRAEIELSRGRHVEAAQAARDMFDPRYTAAQPLLAAGLFARCVPLAEADGQLGSRRRLELVSSYLAEAADALERAAATGAVLGSLPPEAQAALRATPELASLVARLEALPTEPEPGE